MAYKLLERYEPLDYFIIIGYTNCAVTSTEKYSEHAFHLVFHFIKNLAHIPFPIYG